MTETTIVGAEPQTTPEAPVDAEVIRRWYRAYISRVGFKFWRDLMWLLAVDAAPFWCLAILIGAASGEVQGTELDTIYAVAGLALLASLIGGVLGLGLHVGYRHKRQFVESFDRFSLTHDAEHSRQQHLFLERYAKATRSRLSAERLLYSSVAGSLIVAAVIGVWFVIIGVMLHANMIPQCTGSPLDITPAMRDLCILSGFWYTGAAVFMVFVAVMTVFWKHLRDRIAELVERLLELHLRQEFVSTTLSDPMQRNAFKLLKLNEHELGKYYRLNLRQNSTVFYVGFGTMMLGFVIIGITLYIVATSETDKEMVSAILGGVGALLTNFIAAIYLHLHGKSSDAMVQFHRRLADSNDLFLAHVLASLIDDEAKRYNALLELSRGIGSRGGGKD